MSHWTLWLFHNQAKAWSDLGKQEQFLKWQKAGITYETSCQ